MTTLTDKQQTFVGPILAARMPTHGASLAGVVGIDFDRHTRVEQRFVGNHGVQLGKGPLRVSSIRLALFARNFLYPFAVFLALAFASLRSLSDVG